MKEKSNPIGLTDTVIPGGYCVGCGVCCVPKQSPFQMHFNTFGALVATKSKNDIEPDGLASICPFSDASDSEDQIAERLFPHAPHVHPSIGRYQNLYAGYAKSNIFHSVGSSGGVTSWLLSSLLRKDLVDAIIHVRSNKNAEEGTLFEYAISTTEQEVLFGAKSRYYPVSLANQLRRVLKNQNDTQLLVFHVS